MPEDSIIQEAYETHDCKLSPEDSCSVCEKWFDQIFDRLYMEGKVAEGVLDDDLPDAKDRWVEEQLSQKAGEMPEPKCQFCEGTGKIEKMEGYRDPDSGVYHSEGTGIYEPCFNCQNHE